MLCTNDKGVKNQDQSLKTAKTFSLEEGKNLFFAGRERPLFCRTGKTFFAARERTFCKFLVQEINLKYSMLPNIWDAGEFLHKNSIF